MPFTRSSDHRTLRPRPPPKPKSQSHNSPSKSGFSSSPSSSQPSSKKKKRKASNISSTSSSTTSSFSPSKLKVKFSSSTYTAVASSTNKRSTTKSKRPPPQSKTPNDDTKKRKTRVIIVGAGIAGLSAARELLHRRYDVLVLEARSRPGGRLKTCQMHLSKPSPDNKKEQLTAPIDLGGGFIHGINKNPVYDLCKKMGLRTHPFHSSSCLLVNDMGWPIDYEEDKKVNDKFNFVLGESQKICALQARSDEEEEEGGAEGDGENGVGDCEESLKILWEKLGNKTGKKDEKAELTEKKKEVEMEKEAGVEEDVDVEQPKPTTKETEQMTNSPSSNNSSSSNNMKSSTKKIHPYHRHLDPKIPFGTIFETLTDHYASNLSHTEELLYQWHKANLEMSCGTSLDKLGQNWNEDEQYSFGGLHVVVKNGFSELISGLEEGLGGSGSATGGGGGRVKYGMEVKEIKIVGKDTQLQKQKEKKVKEEETKNEASESIPNDKDENEEECDSSQRRRSRRAHNKINYAESSLEKNIIYDEKEDTKDKNDDSEEEDKNQNDEEPSFSQVLVTVQPIMNSTDTQKQQEGKDSKPITLQADAVILTLPLGILSLPPTHPQHVSFYPPLPARKQEAISKLGFGTYNKCALAFSHIFWTQSDFIGYVGPDPGRNIIFMNISVVHTKNKKPILIMVYGSKHASDVDDKLKDSDVVRECLDVLRKICGKKDIPQPVDYAVTRWGKEKYSKGGFSFVPPGVKGAEEFGIMGQPIYDPIDESGGEDEKDEVTHLNDSGEKDKEVKEEGERRESNVITNKEKDKHGKKEASKPSLHRRPRRPLVLFAGEATTPYHPSTIHGAYLSGIREAYRLDLSLEPALNRYIEFDESYLYRRTFSVKKRKRKAGEEDEEDIEEDWEDKQTKKVGGSGGGGQQHQQQQGSGGVRQRKRREVSVLSSSMATSQQKKLNSSSMGMRGKRSRGNDVSFSGQDREHQDIGGENSGRLSLSVSEQQQQEMQKESRKIGFDQDEEPVNTKQNGPLAKSFFEDLTILRGADSYGTDKAGWNFVRSRMMPPLLDEEYKYLLRGRNSGEEGSTDKRKKGQTKPKSRDKRNKSTDYLSARYQQLIAAKDVSEKDDYQDSSAFMDQNEKIENLWYLPDGSGTWLAEKKVLKAAEETFHLNLTAVREESKSTVGNESRKGDTSTTPSVSSLSSLSSRRKSPRKVTPKKRMNI